MEWVLIALGWIGMRTLGTGPVIDWDGPVPNCPAVEND